MATPHYDPDTEDIVYHVHPDDDDSYDQDDSDMQTISSASTSRTTSTITSDEISDYFREAHGRIFPLDENLPLTYPVDDIEVRRHQMQHVMLKALMHGNYIGPVKEVLKPHADGPRPRILDIRTCAGDWAQDMAEEFPHCDITSVDITPVATHAPRANIAFEVYDLYAGVAEPDESFDYVSCRHVQLAVKEYDRLIFDLHRVLRPGGLITVCEVENQMYEVDRPPYNTPAYHTFPNNCRASDIFRASATSQGIDFNAIHQVHKWLEPNSQFWAETAKKYGIPDVQLRTVSRGFRDVHKETVLIPTGTWHPDPSVKKVGSLASRLWTLAWKQLGALLIEEGLTPEEANELANSAVKELQDTELPILAKYHVIYGTKA
ncbi:S-adenosyl-L-methionine-dependent methyltransferase [Ceratobasidium sp. AG-I]|nr:S-adenosyl-L-methionine-dependent methyltransferase [Ceratobasidium sp. AG-I]